MPKGPQGQARPTDAIGCAVKVARIATGEERDPPAKEPTALRRFFDKTASLFQGKPESAVHSGSDCHV